MSNSRDDDAVNHNPELEECNLSMDGETYRSFSAAPATGGGMGFSNFCGSELEPEVFRGLAPMQAPVAAMPSFWDSALGPMQPNPAQEKTSSWDNQKATSWDLPPKPSLLPSGKLDGPSLMPTNDFACMSLPSVDSSSFVVRPLKPTPEYYEKYSSFLSHSPPGELLASICALLDEAAGCDHEFVKAKNKVRGVARMDPSGRARFVIKVYRHTDSELMVEFHRREGCVVTFNQFYQRTCSSLGSHFVRRATAAATATEAVGFACAAALPALSLPEVEKTPLESECDVQCLLEKLCEEAACDYVDSQRQALCALAHLTSAAENRCLLNGENSVATLRKVLVSNDEVVLENACRFLVNVCNEECCREPVVKQLLQELFTVLEAPGTLENCASKRHVAECFAILSSSHANVMKGVFAECPHYADTLRRYTQYHDECLQKNITATLSQIEAA